MENVKDPEGAGARFSPGRVAQEVRFQLPRHPLLRPSTQHCGIDLGRRLSGPGLQGPRMGTSVQMTEDPSHPSLAGGKTKDPCHPSLAGGKTKDPCHPSLAGGKTKNLQSP